jgi:hypothetical protein
MSGEINRLGNIAVGQNDHFTRPGQTRDGEKRRAKPKQS